jgi:hypothetical protein
MHLGMQCFIDEAKLLKDKKQEKSVENSFKKTRNKGLGL